MARRRQRIARDALPHRCGRRDPSRSFQHRRRQHQSAAVAPGGRRTRRQLAGDGDVKLAQSFSWGRLAMVLNNVFDRKYYTYAVRSQFTADKYAVYPLPGRTLSLTAEVALR